jgi:hypothetical protein
MLALRMKIDEEGTLFNVACSGPAMLHVRTLTIAVACAVLSLAGCGGGDDHRGPATFTTQILSDSSYDGDIEQTGPGTYVVTQGMSPTVQSVFSGIDPATGTEFRTFLDFPLTGPSGVPANAGIDSAFVELYVDSLQPATGSLPLLVELVSFQPPTMIGSDFDRTAQPPLASVRVSPPISRSDVGTYVPIDVTPLMIQAQRLGLPDLQLRIMEDLGPPITTLMEIDDTTGANRPARAPLLTVTYF